MRDHFASGLGASTPCSVVIVAHNNGATVVRTVQSVLEQTPSAHRVVLIDCGSDDTSWLERFKGQERVTTIAAKNLGYAGGNNLGWRALELLDDDSVLFLNPDVLLPPGFLGEMAKVAADMRARRYAMISPRLLSYDFETDRPIGAIDSTGIFSTFWGGWRDRRDDSPAEGKTLEAVPALCGACLWASAGALRSAALKPGEVFDSRYFAYKEDIELSLRLRRAGWQLAIWHGAFAWHGRGWRERKAMPHASRLLSARNELRLHARYAPLRLPFSAVKWFYVRWLER
jgi:N-acetylglucosaminyl-diphospho-decaprenol L-rhamnosyltransferase